MLSGHLEWVLSVFHVRVNDYTFNIRAELGLEISMVSTALSVRKLNELRGDPA